ncbi:MAG: hypothetical protein IAE65_08435 [Ignavibacteria bacterium]|nr:hypothetical protein [Ignavibacteria bacterium]
MDSRKIFLLDGIGGLITSFMLFLVLRNFEEYFGMPGNVLIWLSALGLVYGIYSLSCYFFVRADLKIFLKVIAVANVIYCLITGLLIYVHYNSLTSLGVIYFVIEIFIILGLVRMEFRLVGGE